MLKKWEPKYKLNGFFLANIAVVAAAVVVPNYSEQNIQTQWVELGRACACVVKYV